MFPPLLVFVVTNERGGSIPFVAFVTTEELCDTHPFSKI